MPLHPSDLESVRDSVGVSSARLDRALEILDSWVTQGRAPGVAAVVIRRGQVVARHFRGLAAPGDASRPLNAESVFPLSSVTKPFVAVAAMTLVESGEILLDDPLSMYISDFGRGGKEGVRIRHLLAHSSGLPDMPPNNDSLRKAQASLPAFVRSTARSDLSFTPGTRVSYSSMGTLMLAEIIERVAKQRVSEYMADRIFEPLGLTQTVFRPDSAFYPRIVNLRLADGRKATPWDSNSTYWRQLGAPWGGLYSTVSELATLGGHFLDLVTGNASQSPVISPTSARLMVQNHTKSIPAFSGGNEGWGYGWALPACLPNRFAGDLCSTETFGHNGASGTLFWADPARELVCVVLTNQMVNWGVDSRRFGAFSNAVIASVIR